MLPRWRNLADAPIDVKVMLYRGADTDALVRAVADLGIAQDAIRANRYPIPEYHITFDHHIDIDANIPAALQPAPDIEA